MNDDITDVGDWDLGSAKIFFDQPTARMYSFDARLEAEGIIVAKFFERLHPDDVARIESDLV